MFREVKEIIIFCGFLIVGVFMSDERKLEFMQKRIKKIKESKKGE